jgi:hypothetical protein
VVCEGFLRLKDLADGGGAFAMTYYELQLSVMLDLACHPRAAHTSSSIVFVPDWHRDQYITVILAVQSSKFS